MLRMRSARHIWVPARFVHCRFGGLQWIKCGVTLRHNSIVSYEAQRTGVDHCLCNRGKDCEARDASASGKL